jgi:hypothetical protein
MGVSFFCLFEVAPQAPLPLDLVDIGAQSELGRTWAAINAQIHTILGMHVKLQMGVEPIE